MGILHYSSARARYFDANAKPLSLGSVTYYYAGTTTLKEIYTDKDLTTQAQNPQVLDINGYVREGGIWLGAGDYKMILKDSNGNTLWTQDDIQGENITAGSLNTIFVESIQDMKDLTPGDYPFVYVAGYYSVTDNGGGYFYYDSTNTDTDDGGYVINSTGAPASGRYLRINTDNYASVSQFGMSNENTGTVNSILTNAQTYVTSNSFRKVLKIDVGGELSGNITLTGDYRLEILPNVKFTASSPYTLTIQTSEAEGIGRNEIVDDTALLSWQPENKEDSYPEWWGVNGPDLENRIALNNIDSNSTIVFTDNYSLAPQTAISAVSVSGCHFKKGSTVSLIGSFAETSEFLNITWDVDASDIFTGGFYESLRFNQPISVNLFEGVLTDATKYENMLQGITNLKTKQGHLLWKSLVASRLISPTITFVDKTYPIVSTIENSLFSLSTDLYIGNVTNNNEKIIDSNTLSIPIITNSSYKLAWLGIQDGDDSTIVADNWTQLSKIDAFTANLLTRGIVPIWDGNNTRVKVAKTVSISSSTGILYLQNVEIKESSNVTWDAASNKFINIDMSCVFDNVNMDNQGREFYVNSSNSINFTWKNSSYTNNDVFTTNSFLIDTAGDVVLDNITTDISNTNDGSNIGATTAANSIKIDNCYFLSRSTGMGCASTDLITVKNTTFENGTLSTLSTNTGHVFVRDCIVKGETAPGAPVGILFNTAPSCDVEGCDVEGTFLIYQGTYNGKGYKIRGNTLAKSLQFFDVTPNNTNLKDILIVSNQLGDFLKFTGSGSTTAKGVIITNNIFRANTASSGSEFIQTSSFATLGHYDCCVENNIHSRPDGTLGTNVPGTTTRLQVTAPGTGSQTFACREDVSGVIFPLFNHPLTGYVSYGSGTVPAGSPVISSPPTFYSTAGNSTTTATGVVNLDFLQVATVNVICNWQSHIYPQS